MRHESVHFHPRNERAAKPELPSDRIVVNLVVRRRGGIEGIHFVWSSKHGGRPHATQDGRSILPPLEHMSDSAACERQGLGTVGPHRRMADVFALRGSSSTLLKKLVTATRPSFILRFQVGGPQLGVSPNS